MVRPGHPEKDALAFFAAEVRLPVCLESRLQPAGPAPVRAQDLETRPSASPPVVPLLYAKLANYFRTIPPGRHDQSPGNLTTIG